MKDTFTLFVLLVLCTFLKAQTFTHTLHLDGNIQFATLPLGTLNGATVFTVEFWVKTTESRSNGTFWQTPTLFGLVTNGGNSGDFGLTTDNGYIAMFDGFSSNGNDQNVESPTVKINDNKWHHIAAVNNGTHLYLYVDGKKLDSLLSGNPILTSTTPLTIEWPCNNVSQLE